ncbi:MAG: FCD domain-containing protein [Paracoccaceae bacterium]
MFLRHEPLKDDAPVASLRAYISEGGYKAGDRLPAERELTAKLDMTRATLRKALDALEREGTLWRHVGKGTFVASRDDGKPANALVELGRQLTPFRMMRARLVIEPAIAREAAVNASGQAMAQMQVAMERAHSASNWRDYEVQDDVFHRSIAEASDNLLLLALFDQLNLVRRAVAWGSVSRETSRPPVDHSSFAEHEAIASSIAERSPDAAYEAMRNHLRSVSERLFGEV